MRASLNPAGSRPHKKAVGLANLQDPSGTDLAYAYYILGRLTLASDPDTSLQSFLRAGRIYQDRPDTAIQEAHVALQVAAFQLAAGRGDTAVTLIDQNLPVVRKTEHAALLALMLLVKAEGLKLMERTTQAAAVQNEALAWARYGYGSEAVIRERVAEITSISPRLREG